MPYSQYGTLGEGAMRHFGVPSSLTTASQGLDMSAVKAVYQKICCAMCPWAGTGPDSENVMPCASRGAYSRIQSTYFCVAKTAAGPLVAPPRVTLEPTGWQSSTRIPHSSTGKPLGRPLSPAPAMENQASVKRQPRDGSFLP